METKIRLPLGTAGVRNEFPPDNAGNGAKRASALELAVLTCMTPSSRENFAPDPLAKGRGRVEKAKPAARAEVPKAPVKVWILQDHLRDLFGNHLVNFGNAGIAETPKIVSRDGIAPIA